MSSHISSSYHFSERIKSQSHVLMCPKSTWKGEDYDVIDIHYNGAMWFLLKGSQYMLKFQSIYGRKSADRTEHGNYVIFFGFFGHCFRQFRGLKSQEMKYFLKIYEGGSVGMLSYEPCQPFI